MTKPNKRTPYQGEVWLVKFDQIKETRKPFRPCVIISNNNQNEYDQEIIILPLTTEEVIVGEIQPFEIPIENNKETGLDEPSRILTNRIHTIDKELRLIKRLGKINQESWQKIIIALCIVITGKKEIK